MSLDISLVSASRVEHINKSNNEAQATEMGFLEKIVDFFRERIFGSSKEEAIKVLYTLIQDIKQSGSFSEAFEKFHGLRGKALADCRENFVADIFKKDNGGWGYSLSINGYEISAGNIDSDEDKEKLSQLINKQLGMKLEDAFHSGKAEPLLSTLEEIAKKIDEEWYMTASKEDFLDAIVRNKFAQNKMEGVISSLPPEIRESIHDKVTGGFGSRLRGVLGYAAEVLSLAVDPRHKLFSLERDGVLLSIPTKIKSRFDSLVTIFSSVLGKTEQKIAPAEQINRSKELTLDEIDALRSLGIK